VTMARAMNDDWDGPDPDARALADRITQAIRHRARGEASGPGDSDPHGDTAVRNITSSVWD